MARRNYKTKEQVISQGKRLYDEYMKRGNERAAEAVRRTTERYVRNMSKIIYYRRATDSVHSKGRTKYNVHEAAFNKIPMTTKQRMGGNAG